MFSSEKEIKMALFQADLEEGFQSSESWAALCEQVVKSGSAHEAFGEYEGKYRHHMRSGDQKGLAVALHGDMLDNYIVGAFAAKLVGIPREAPLIAWSAANKREFPGWHGEIATIRTLLWAGFDPNAQDDKGATGLHYMVNLKYGSGCNPRAVRDLLEAGCDPNIAHKGGDTALHTLCGHMGWTEEHSACFKLLIDADGDFLASSSDGSTPISLLLQCEQQSHQPERAELLAFLEAAMAAAAGTEAPGAQAVPAPESPAQAQPKARESSSDEVPPELLAAAKAWREKGGRLGALGRWANSAKPTPESQARHAELDLAWAKRRLGTPEGDRIIAEARKAATSKNAE